MLKQDSVMKKDKTQFIVQIFSFCLLIRITLTEVIVLFTKHLVKHLESAHFELHTWKTYSTDFLQLLTEKETLLWKDVCLFRLTALPRHSVLYKHPSPSQVCTGVCTVSAGRCKSACVCVCFGFGGVGTHLGQLIIERK